jgi:hypothetical protein
MRPILVLLMAFILAIVAAETADAAVLAHAKADMILHSGPAAKGVRLAVIPKGSPVHVLRCNRRWCRVAYAGRVGYASPRDLTPVSRTSLNRFRALDPDHVAPSLRLRPTQRLRVARDLPWIRRHGIPRKSEASPWGFDDDDYGYRPYEYRHYGYGQYGYK